MRYSRKQWQQRATEHFQRAARYTIPHLQRRRAGTSHPVYDFLFDYYPVRTAHLERWHPGAGIELEDAPTHATWKYYRTDGNVTTLSTGAFVAARANTVTYIRTLLSNTLTNPAHFDCFGLHEWAMVYQSENPRHSLPLRLGRAGTDHVVETHQLRCTHVDAFRFFTEPARPKNVSALPLVRVNQPAVEQQGCVHATMDLYKWATKLTPLVPSELVLDCFALAWDARILDMEASPYDCRELGLGVVPIETPKGKLEYVRRQRDLAARALPLRHRLIGTINHALNLVPID